MVEVQNKNTEGFFNTSEELQPKLCPECGSVNVIKAGFRYPDGVAVQRFHCKKCEKRFSKSYKTSTGINSHQLSVILQGAKKLDSATETKTVAGEMEKNQQEIKGKIFDFLLYLNRQNYSEETIRLNRSSLNTLVNRGANLFDSDSVKDVMKAQKWSPNRQRNVIIAYTNFLKHNKLEWEPPLCKVTDTFPFIPTEQELDALITSAPNKLSTFLLLLKETAMRRGEAKRLQWTDLDKERNTLTLNLPEKNSNARIWKLSAQLMAQLDALPRESEIIFGNARMDSLKVAYLRLRHKQADKLKNPRLLKIGFHTFRHWKGTMLYHRTKDALYVRDFLGHKSIKNTEKYINIERKLFADYTGDEYSVKVTSEPHEATTLLEQGFEWVGVKENLIFLRKRK
ncbi:MAG: tyrosine-type recombinase/integrase [Candidatus Bathyarchaeota archaeon]|nr:tyrosine-type recombinase/integrase [Candidatus Termiticorpusculum sp.]